MADLTISISLDATGITSGVAKAKSEMESLARTSFEKLGDSLQSVAGKIRDVGSVVSSLGQSLTSNITAPLVSLGTSAVNTSASFDALKQGLIAIEGSSDQAEAAFTRLREVAKLPGLGFKEAVQGYTNLRAAGLGADLAERSLKAFGNALATVGKGKNELDGVTTALQQMQAKGKVSAEEINQIAERLPQMRQAMKDAFGTTDTSALEKMGIDSEKFINGIVAQLEKVPQARGGITGAFENMGDTIEMALKPIGDTINSFLVPAIEAITPYIDQAAKAFDNLSPAAKGVIVGILAIAAAIGPVILIIGGIITGIGAFVAAISAIAAAGSVALVIGAIAAAIGVLVAGVGIAIGIVFALHEAWQNGFGPIASVVAIAVGLIITAFSPILGLPILIGAVAVTIYEMWQQNFGGLQDFTTQVWAKIQEYIAIAMAAIQQLVAEIGGDVIAWWSENYPLIQQTVQTVSDAVKSYIQNFLAAITAFWDAHGTQIMSVVRSIWTIISTIVRTGVQVIMQVVRLVMQVINGDWSGAWNTAKDIVSRIITAIGTVLKELGNIVMQALKFVVTTIVGWGTDLFNKAVDIGKNIVQGIINGIGALAKSLWDKGRSLVAGLLGGMRDEGSIKSPSEETYSDGVNYVQGFINAFDVMSGDLNQAGRKLIKGMLTEMRKEHKKAAAEFYAMWNMPTEGQQMMGEAQGYQAKRSGLENLIKLRAELNMNVGDELPFTLEGINLELEKIGRQKQGIADAKQMLQQMQDQLKADPVKAKTNSGRVDMLLADASRNQRIDGETQSELRRNAALLDARIRTEQLNEAKRKIAETGAANNIQLQGEINLLQAQIAANFKLSEAEAQRIRNLTELEKYKADLANQGYTEAEIASLAAALEVQQRITESKRAELRTLQDTISANQTYTSAADQMAKTLEQLNVQLGLKQAASEADRLATDLQTDAYKKLNAQQVQNLKDMAAQIDSKREEIKAKEEAKKQMDEFKGFIKESLGTIARDGFGAFFKGIFEKFKQMLIDMATEWLASKIYKILFQGGANGEGIGGAFSKVLQALGFAKKKDATVANPGGGGGGAANAHEAMHAKELADKGGAAAGGGLFGPVDNIITGKSSKLAGKMSGIGSLMTLAGGLIGGRVGGILSMAGTGMSMGAMFGPWGAAIGAVAGGLIGLFMGDPKKKIDKKENMPKLQKGFTEALQQLRDLLSDRNQIFSDPDGAVSRAMDIRGQIASGFGIEFQSKKYKKIAQQQIAGKLVEADAIIKQIKEMADVARMAGKVDTRLEAEFASGVFADAAFIRQHADFRRRNGLLPGGWTGRDTLPSMLAPGEMVLNPKQIARVKFNAGFDAFKGAGIPNYASGTFVGGAVTSAAPSLAPAPQPVTVQIVLNNSGIVESDIKGVLVDGLKSSDVQVELVKAYDKGKTRTR